MRVLNSDGNEVQGGTLVKDFRGDTWRVLEGTRETDEAHAGKVLVDSVPGGFTREFYATVFNFKVVR